MLTSIGYFLQLSSSYNYGGRKLTSSTEIHMTREPKYQWITSIKSTIKIPIHFHRHWGMDIWALLYLSNILGVAIFHRVLFTGIKQHVLCQPKNKLKHTHTHTHTQMTKTKFPKWIYIPHPTARSTCLKLSIQNCLV